MNSNTEDAMPGHILVSSLIALWGCLMATLWPMAWRLHLSIALHGRRRLVPLPGAKPAPSSAA
jgi:hypothetical protein